MPMGAPAQGCPHAIATKAPQKIRAGTKPLSVQDGLAGSARQQAGHAASPSRTAWLDLLFCTFSLYPGLPRLLNRQNDSEGPSTRVSAVLSSSPRLYLRSDWRRFRGRASEKLSFESSQINIG